MLVRLREPAFWTHAAAVVAALLVTLPFHFTAQQQGWWDGAVAAVAGIIVAYLTRDGAFAAALGLLKAAFMVLLGYHWVPGYLANVTPDQMLAVFTALAGLSAAYTRTQAIAPVQPVDSTVGTVVPPAPPPTIP